MVEWIDPSVAEDGQVELAEARRVGDHVDLGNLVVLDRETDGEAQLSTGGHDDSHRAVNERRSRESRRPREHAGLLRHGLGAAELCRARRERGAVGSAHDVGIEDR